MANIHFSLAGEGRGHAARARTLVDELSKRHTVTLHTFGDAYSFLSPLYAGSDVAVEELPGLRFRYDRRGRVDYVRSGLANAPALARIARTSQRLADRLRSERADLVLNDFEPALPRAARRAGVPVLGIDHQSVLAHADLGALPAHLRRHAAFLGFFVKRWTPRADLRVASSFYRPGRKAGSEDVRFVGVLLREAVRRATVTVEDHLVAYVRSGTPDSALDVLARSPIEVRVYGRGWFPPRGALVPREVSEDGFLADLASCTAVVTTAGNQLVGEAIHLDKPVLGLPEPGNREQEINAWFLQASGAGRALDFDRLDDAALRGFLDEVPTLRVACRGTDVDGTRPTLDLIDSALAGGLSPAPAGGFGVRRPRQA
ncbi:MAG: glycosyltransferase family protein [Planctomycetota bacterium]